MAMKTVTIEFDLTEEEYELICQSEVDLLAPDMVRRMALMRARSEVRRQAEEVLRLRYEMDRRLGEDGAPKRLASVRDKYPKNKLTIAPKPESDK
jgi:hypothetical protein